MKTLSLRKILTQIQQQAANVSGSRKYFLLRFTRARRETDWEVNDASITLTYSRAHKMQTYYSCLRGEKHKRATISSVGVVGSHNKIVFHHDHWYETELDLSTAV